MKKVNVFFLFTYLHRRFCSGSSFVVDELAGRDLSSEWCGTCSPAFLAECYRSACSRDHSKLPRVASGSEKTRC